MVFSIQLYSGFQPDNTAIAIIIIAFINCIIICICFFNILKIKSNFKSKSALGFVLFLSIIFLSYGSFSYCCFEEAYYDYPTNGIPVDRNVSFFGHYKNIDDYTLIWLYTISDKIYFEGFPVDKFNPSWPNRGQWTLSKSVVGSDSSNDNGLFFTFTSVKVPMVAERAMYAYLIMYNASSNGTDKLPSWVQENNERVSAYRRY